MRLAPFKNLQLEPVLHEFETELGMSSCYLWLAQNGDQYTGLVTDVPNITYSVTNFVEDLVKSICAQYNIEKANYEHYQYNWVGKPFNTQTYTQVVFNDNRPKWIHLTQAAVEEKFHYCADSFKLRSPGE